MAEIRYYAIVGRGRTVSDPSGLARRSRADNKVVDEALRRDMTWGHTSAIAEWDRGEELTRDLIEISPAQAEELVERFREKWGDEA